MSNDTVIEKSNVMEAESDNTFTGRQVKNADKSLAKLEAQIADLEARVDEALQLEIDAPVAKPEKPDEIDVWGVPYSRLSLADTLHHIDRLIAWGESGYFITANLNYNMLTEQHPELVKVNENASFILCDGMPMVWKSRRTDRPLPERVAGSELIYALNKWASIKGHRVFFLGGAPGVAQTAADKLTERYPGLQVAGVESPPFRPLSDQEQAEMVDRIRESKPDIVYVAFGQPKGELWMAENHEKIGALCVQIGASFDFVAGGVARAPMWVQRAGMEWFYRMAQEPRRLAGRYWKNATFLLRALIKDAFRRGEKL